MAFPPTCSLHFLTSKPIKTRLFFIPILCSILYILGSYTHFINHKTINQRCFLHHHHHHNHSGSPVLQFEPHHFQHFSQNHHNPPFFNLCPSNFTNYCPCHDPSRDTQFLDKERHCPNTHFHRVRCLTPKPVGYKKPFPWPKSKANAWFSNVPFPKLTQSKKSQNWVRLEGQRFVFPGGGTSFPRGVKGYIDAINRIVPLKSGYIRTVLDVGCGVASFGGALMDYNILTMSIAPRDSHEAQVQFALERGLPAMLAVLSTHRLPFPSRSFDMAHCSRCLVPWTHNGGLNLLEMDRVLRPGGYWVLSGPPINWKLNYVGWKVEARVLEKNQRILEDLARRMCWKKVAEKENIAVWQKPTNHIHCAQKLRAWKSLHFCTSSDADAAWYTNMSACIFPLPEVKDINEVSGGGLEKWPKRLNTAPPRIRNGMMTVRMFNEDNEKWKRRVWYYESIVKSVGSGKYRNVMDMNAGLGGFATAMAKYPVWVMNVVPFDAKNNSLGVIYERGFIGTYMNWCDITDILLEMHRILRPEGGVVIRDHVDRFSNQKHFRKERHCPQPNESLRCLIPKPPGYRKPFPWPTSKYFAWFTNVPFTKLAVYKKSQNWVRLEGDRFLFPGGGTSFPDGVEGYVEALNRLLPLKSGNIRTALDVGCGVASFGASLLDYNILTMSVAPSDEHQAQIMFALERGIPAMLGVLSINRLPFPSKSFDMAHCSRCLVPWTAYDGLYLMEMDRILRPGGYWVMSGPPINWRENYKGWETEPKDLERRQNILEDLAKRLCWRKVAERGDIAVWQKHTNHIHCIQLKKIWKSPEFCSSSDADVAW
ncbi:putative methyltransferase PMT19 [Senna tora]|uniref:Putative methyltransferase PMT19 n=1 Tax=Senna tora TaxID=362788 RepID=A0A834X297_9FABA|nr:putative methyltransferase PMT19 [Senna tora]